LIENGRVAVDGEIVRRQGVGIDPEVNRVEVDGQPVRPQAKVWLILNKPPGILCTARDPQGRRTFLSLLPATLGQRVYTVGRLDRDSEGLLVVTNDGALAQALMHPRHNVEKTYLVWPGRRLSAAEEQRLRQGVRSQGELLLLDELERIGDIYRVRLQEGRNRHIRRMFAALGVEIKRLKRVAIGPLQLGNLRSGGWRNLAAGEIRELRQYINERSGT
jgi:23S rRNA pseudouridine2605 synthase